MSNFLTESINQALNHIEPVQGSGPDFYKKPNSDTESNAEFFARNTFSYKRKKLTRIIESDKGYASHFLTIISQLFSLPTRNFSWDYYYMAGDDYAGNFFRNLFRWHNRSAPTWQKVINFFFIPPLLAFGWHALKAIPSFVLNITYIIANTITDIPLNLLLVLINVLMEKPFPFLLKKIKSAKAFLISKIFLYAPLLLGVGILYVAGWICIGATALTQKIVDSIFAPLNTFKALWETEGFFPKAFAFLLLLTSVAAFTALAIYGLPFLITGITVYAPAFLPAFMSAGLNTALTAFTALADTAAFIFAPIGAVITSVLGSIALPAFASTLITDTLIGIAAVTGAALPLLGTLISFISEKLGDWYYGLGVDNFTNPLKQDTYDNEENELIYPNISPHHLPTSHSRKPAPAQDYSNASSSGFSASPHNPPHAQNPSSFSYASSNQQQQTETIFSKPSSTSLFSNK